MEKQYAERDAYELDVAGGYYCRHVSAMTSEGLHSKGDIAAELGHRDMVITELLESLQCLFDDYKELADSGDAGNWRIEDKPAGKKALYAIAKALGKE